MSVKKQRPIQIPFGIVRHFDVKNHNLSAGVAVIVSQRNTWFMSALKSRKRGQDLSAISASMVFWARDVRYTAVCQSSQIKVWMRCRIRAFDVLCVRSALNSGKYKTYILVTGVKLVWVCPSKCDIFCNMIQFTKSILYFFPLGRPSQRNFSNAWSVIVADV